MQEIINQEKQREPNNMGLYHPALIHYFKTHEIKGNKLDWVKLISIMMPIITANLERFNYNDMDYIEAILKRKGNQKLWELYNNHYEKEIQEIYKTYPTYFKDNQ